MMSHWTRRSKLWQTCRFQVRTGDPADDSRAPIHQLSILGECLHHGDQFRLIRRARALSRTLRLRSHALGSVVAAILYTLVRLVMSVLRIRK